MTGNNEKRERKKEMSDAEEIKEILGAVSEGIPALIKGVIASVFSEEAGKSMGKAAAAFYKELKESGMPDEVAVKMTENYISVFTSLGDLMKKFTKGEKIPTKLEKEIEEIVEEAIEEAKEKGVSEKLGKEIEKRVKEKLAEKGLLEEEE